MAASVPFLVVCSALKACGVMGLLLAARGAVWLVNMMVVAPMSDPLKYVQGPEGSALQNHFREIME